jgi:carbon-monoxide dehydrogenase medium subunit
LQKSEIRGKLKTEAILIQGEHMLARSVLPGFDYIRATTPDQVVELLQRWNGGSSSQDRDGVRLLMGGTDLLVRMRDGFIRPRLVVDVKHLPGMGEVTYDEPTGLTVGAAVTMNRLAGHPAVQAHYPLLAESANSVASYQLRNRATLGGNLGNASPAADTAPAALLLEATIVLFGPNGEREVPAAGFFLGPGRTAMQPGEFITAIRFPPPPDGAVGRYLKLGRNRAGDLAIAGVAVLGFPDHAAPSGHRFRIGLASVAPVPLRAQEAEALLSNSPPVEETFAVAAAKSAAAASPIDDVRASAAYRRAMVCSLTLRALRDVWARLADS